MGENMGENPSIVDILKRYFEFSIETTQLRQLILLPYGEHSKLIFAYLENAKKSRSIHLMRSNKNLHVINVSHMGDKYTKRCAQVMVDIASWPPKSILTYWGRVTHICVSNQITIGSDIGLSPGRRQAIFWTNAGTLLIGPLGTNFSEILIDIDTFSLNAFENVVRKMTAIWSRPQCVNTNIVGIKTY